MPDATLAAAPKPVSQRIAAVAWLRTPTSGFFASRSGGLGTAEAVDDPQADEDERVKEIKRRSDTR